MPTTTKTKTTEATRAANTKRAQELFKAGQRIAKGENPTGKDSLPVQPAAARKPFLCGSQEVIADAIAEMITTGGTEENLTMVILAVIDHDWRRRFGRGVNEGESRTRHSDYADRETRRILDELAVARTKRTKLDNGERPEPADVVGRIRENAREQCANALQELLDTASPEEHRFISAVMLNYRSAHGGQEGYGDMGLASAFQEEIHNGYEYLRVPARLREDIHTYMDALIKAYPTGKPKKDAA